MARTRRSAIDNGFQDSGQDWSQTSAGFEIGFFGHYAQFQLDFGLWIGDSYVSTVVLWDNGLLSFGEVTQDQIDYRNGVLAAARFPGIHIDTDLGGGGSSYQYAIGVVDYVDDEPDDPDDGFEYGDAIDTAFFDFGFDTPQLIIDQYGWSVVSTSDFEIDSGYYDWAGWSTFVDGSDANVLVGSGFDERFIGGAGADLITGRAGRDVFEYAEVADSALATGVDRITDFETGVDAVYVAGLEISAIWVEWGNGRYLLNIQTAQGDITIESDQPITDADVRGDHWRHVGTAYADLLPGRAGTNVFDGGGGGDTLDGSQGPSEFLYDAVSDSGALTGVDRITGFGADDSILFAGLVGTALAVEWIDGRPTRLALGTGQGELVIDFANAAPVSSQDFRDRLYVELAMAGDAAANLVEGARLDDSLAGNGGSDTLLGYLGDDTLLGGAGDDVLRGDDGSDSIAGGDGHDTISYGAGQNAVSGGAGNDTIEAGAYSANGNTIDGGAGNDRISAGSGYDSLTGGDGNDTLYGGWGDTIDGGNGIDSLDLDGPYRVSLPDGWVKGFYSDAIVSQVYNVEHLIGGYGDDQFTGNDLANSLEGGDGNDSLDGGAGIDTLLGGYGADLYYLRDAGDVVTEVAGDTTARDTVHSYLSSYTLPPEVEDGWIRIGGVANLAGNALGNLLYAGTGNNTLNGLAGIDTVSYVQGTTGPGGVSVSLATTAFQTTGGSGSDRLLNIENLVGSSNADNLGGSTAANRLEGLAGNDTLRGGAGDDFLDGGSDADSLVGGDGGDTLVGGAGSDTLDGYLGNDSLVGGDSGESLVGGAGDDTLVGGAGADTVDGGAGSDSIEAGAGDNTIHAGDGDNVVRAGSSDASSGNTVTAGNGHNQITLHSQWGAGNNVIDVGDGDNTVYVFGAVSTVLLAGNGDNAIEIDNPGLNDISVGDGDNTIRGGGTVQAGTGADRITGADTSDTLHGGGGDDTIEGGYGLDQVFGDAGNDLLSDRSGNSTLDGGDGYDLLRVDLGWMYTTSVVLANDTDGSVHYPNYNGVVRAIDMEGALVFGTSNADTITGAAWGDTITGGGGFDVIDGGGGTDRVVLDFDHHAYIDLQNADPVKAGGGIVSLTGIESVQTTGTAYDDVIAGGDGADLVASTGGDDILLGMGGDDQLGALLGDLRGGDGNDTLAVSGARPTPGANQASPYFLTPNFNHGMDRALSLDPYFRLVTHPEVTDSATTPHARIAITGSGSAMYYAITVTEPDTLATFDIDGGFTTQNGNYDSNVRILDASGFQIAQNDAYYEGPDPGSSSIWDSYFTHTFEQPGTYYVVLSSYLSPVVPEGIRFTLNVTMSHPVTSSVLNGDAGDDRLTGGSGSDMLHGGSGNDTADFANAGAAVDASLLTGRAVSVATDFLFGIENLVGTAFDDRLTGDASANLLAGMQGGDVLDGGAGADTMQGGDGSDTFQVRDSGDLVIETDPSAAIGGTDTVVSFLGSYTLPQYVERGRIASAGTASLTGNGLDNTLYAGIGNNVLNGGAGSDTVTYALGTSGAGGVTVSLAVTTAQATGGSGTDTLIGIEHLSGSNNADQLTGNAGPNALAGLAGDDLLNGGAGADTMRGGDGSDTYHVRDAGDLVIETNAALDTGGTDTVASFLAGYTLPQYVERGRIVVSGTADLTGNGLDNTLYAGIGNNVLNGGAGVDTVSYRFGVGGTDGVTVSLAVTTAQATGGSGSDSLLDVEHLYGSEYADRLTGNAAANTLAGSVGDDTLRGSTGNDSLHGGSGNDQLTGGGGADMFGFSTPLSAAANVDTVLDFTSGTDTIQLFAGIYTGLPQGTLAASQLRVVSSGNLAGDADDRIIYNSTTGELYYDADGSLPDAASIVFAVLGATQHPLVVAGDFVIAG